jgi:hypothetical protein
MLYNPSPAITTPTRIVTGRNIAHGKRSVIERAFLGADLHLDRIELAEPTIGQAARLVGVCRPYVAAAVIITTDPKTRQAVLSGRVPLLEAVKPSFFREETLAERFARATPEEIAAVANKVGVGRIWDSMIVPHI